MKKNKTHIYTQITVWKGLFSESKHLYAGQKECYIKQIAKYNFQQLLFRLTVALNSSHYNFSFKLQKTCIYIHYRP